MSIGGIAAIGSMLMQSMQDKSKQRNDAMRALESSLNANDLAGARKAFATLKSLGDPSKKDNSTSSGNPGNANNWKSLATALAGGDLAGAQSLFSILRSGAGNDTSKSRAASGDILQTLLGVSQGDTTLDGGDAASNGTRRSRLNVKA